MDVAKRFDGMRLTEDENFQAAQYFLAKVTPAEETPSTPLVSFFDLYDKAEEIAVKGQTMNGLSTGYPSIDGMTKGLGPGELIVIFGYTSMGKSQLSQNIALNIARAGKLVLFLGLELTSEQNSARFINMGGKDRTLPILFPPKPDITYKEIAGLIAQAKQDNLGLVVVDQLQDLIHDTVNEQGEIGQIMAELKRAAITHEVPIIVVSHVNRQGASTGPPALETLKGSASIEQKADIALAVWQDPEADWPDGYAEMQISNRKNRQRGKEVKNAKLTVVDGLRLIDPQDIRSIDNPIRLMLD